MNRREILKYTALATGGAICTPFVSTFLSGCTPGTKESAAVGNLVFFNLKEIEFIKAVIDTILPKTDSPSASEVNVHMAIDEVVGLTYQEDEQKEYKKGFEALKKYLEEQDFMDKNNDERKSILMSLDKGSEEVKSPFLHLKQQSIAYYLSTKEIGTKYLNYLPVPGEYQECIPLSETNGKAWHYEFTF